MGSKAASPCTVVFLGQHVETAPTVEQVSKSAANNFVDVCDIACEHRLRSTNTASFDSKVALVNHFCKSVHAHILDKALGHDALLEEAILPDGVQGNVVLQKQA